MESLYTCVCGGKSWEIYGDRIECVKCHSKYKIDEILGHYTPYIVPPQAFNEKVRRGD
ncbi:hypothetical protein KAX97_12590 [candidate division WOR-3 bacterium]|nr:hypothetical protein [candidate division WOR-3 bacterium]